MGNVLKLNESTVWSPMLTPVNVFLTASISASSMQNPATYKGGNATGSDYDNHPVATTELGVFITPASFQANGGKTWLSDNDPDNALYFDLDNGTGRTEIINSVIIAAPSSTAQSPGGYSISASADDVAVGSVTTWVPLTSSIYYAAGATPAGGYTATMPFSNTTSYRHYKIRNENTSAPYDGIAQVYGWDVNKFTGGGSTHGSASVNLLNPTEANVTASFKGSQGSSLAGLTDGERVNDGWYFIHDAASLDLNWGDGEKLIRGMLLEGFTNTSYYPGKWQIYKSKTGNYNDWNLVSTTDVNAQQDFNNYSYYFIEFGTPIKTQYFRFVTYEEDAEDAPTTNMIAYNGWMYEMVSASAPPPPTTLTSVAQGSNVALTWAQNSGSDNRLVDLIYNVERSDDAGSTYTKISTLSGSVIQMANTGSVGTPVSTYYVDTSVADGDYLYRVQAENKQHFTTGSYATSDSITLPVAAGASKKIYLTNKGNVMINPNDTTLIEV